MQLGDIFGGDWLAGFWVRTSCPFCAILELTFSVWHCTFLVNSYVLGYRHKCFVSLFPSLAHWEGLQPYTDEITARGNLVRVSQVALMSLILLR